MNCWLAYWNINLEDLYTCVQCIYIIVGESKSKIGMSISNFVINIFYDVTIIYFIDTIDTILCPFIFLIK